MHECLAHQNFTHVKSFLKQNGIKTKESLSFCNAQALGKMHRCPFPLSEMHTTQVDEIIHSDLCGPMETNSIGNSRYFLLFKNNFSSYIFMYFIKNKSEVKHCFVNFMQRFEKETSKINILRTDNNLEYANKDLSEIFI